MKDLFGEAFGAIIVLLHGGSLVLLGYRLQVLQVIVETRLLVHDRRGTTYLGHCLHLHFGWRLLRVHVDSKIVRLGHLKDLNVLNCFTITVGCFRRRASAPVAPGTDAVPFLLFGGKGIVCWFNRWVAIELGKRIIDECLLNHRLHSSSLLLLLDLSMQCYFFADLGKFVSLALFLLDEAYHAFSTFLEALLLFFLGIFLFIFRVLELGVVSLVLLVRGLITVGPILAIVRNSLLSQIVVAQILHGPIHRRTIVVFLIRLIVLFVGALSTARTPAVGFLEKSFNGCFANFENREAPVTLVRMLRDDWHVELRYLFAELARSVVRYEFVFSKLDGILLRHALLLVASKETCWSWFVKHVVASLLKDF